MRSFTEGSFTVEIALIFPGILLLLVALIETGLWYRIRIRTDASLQEALMLVETARSRGYTLEEAVFLADGRLDESLEDTGDFSRSWEVRDSYLKESVDLNIWGTYGSILPLSYRESQRLLHPDPRRFRDRVDLICEKLNVK